MKLNNAARVSLLVLIVLIAAGIGWFAVFNPLLKELEKTEASIVNKKTEISAAQVIISENMVLRNNYVSALQEAVDAQKIFYPEMTTIQTIDEVNRILSTGGFKSESGINVSGITSTTLSITLSKLQSSANYEVRQHSFLNEKQVNSKSEVKDENELTRSEVFKKLENGEIVDSKKAETLDFLRSALAMESIEIGRISVNFRLKLSYPEYIAFLEMIENYDKAISINSARFRGDNVSHDEVEEYVFEIFLYVVKPVEEL